MGVEIFDQKNKRFQKEQSRAKDKGKKGVVVEKLRKVWGVQLWGQRGACIKNAKTNIKGGGGVHIIRKSE